jgi:hypothetical protein
MLFPYVDSWQSRLLPPGCGQYVLGKGETFPVRGAETRRESECGQLQAPAALPVQITVTIGYRSRGPGSVPSATRISEK